MSSLLLQTKFVADSAITDEKIKLRNDFYVKARNFADSGDVNIIKLNASNEIEFGSTPKVGGVALALITDVPTVPPVFAIQGNWNATTNTPTLVASTNSTGVDNPLYLVTVAGSTSIDGESVWDIGDWIYFANGVWNKADNNDAVVSVNGASGVVVLDTDDLLEGTNKFLTDVRVENAVMANYVVGADTALANTDDLKGSLGKIQGQINALAGTSQSFGQENFTLIAGDISNQYVDLAQTPLADSIHLEIVGAAGPAVPGVDFTLATNRITFAGDLATLAAIGDILVIHYAY